MEEFDTVGRGFNEQTGDLVDFHCGLSWMGEIENEQKKEQARHARGHDWIKIEMELVHRLTVGTTDALKNGNRGVGQ